MFSPNHSPGALTVFALSGGVVTIARTLEMGDSELDPLDEIIAAVYPTLAYIEDQTRARPEKLFIAGFAHQSESSTRLSAELDIPVETIQEPYPGLVGDLASLASTNIKEEGGCMRIPINLARDPFRRDRPMLIGSALARSHCLRALWFPLFDPTRRHRTRRDKDTQAMLTRANRRLNTMPHRAEQASTPPCVSPVMRLFSTAVFCSIRSFAEKRSAGPKSLADLDTVTPPNVRILSIRPTINAQGGLFLEMQVVADSQEPIIAFVAKLEGSDVRPDRTAVSSIAPPSQTNPFHRYQLTVNYAQKLC